MCRKALDRSLRHVLVVILVKKENSVNVTTRIVYMMFEGAARFKKYINPGFGRSYFLSGGGRATGEGIHIRCVNNA